MATLTPEQESRVREMFGYFPYRIVFVATKDGEQDVVSAVLTMRIPNRLAREGWAVLVVNTAKPTCKECGKPCALGAITHPSCAGFREHINRGGTLD